jgi:predicted ATPase
MPVRRIVLTGGPCAGKTAVVEQLRRAALLRGLHVVLVSETATRVFSDGGAYQPGWADGDRLAHKQLQAMLLQAQLDSEDAMFAVADLQDKARTESTVVILGHKSPMLACVALVWVDIVVLMC